MNIFVGTGITENYVDRAHTFMYGINSLKKADAFVITLGFNASEELKSKYSNIKFIYQDINSVKNELTSIKCLQHGAFVDVISNIDGISEKDIILFSDSDVVIQRDFTDEEIATIKSNHANVDIVTVGKNNYNENSLRTEYHSLKPKIPLSDMCRALEFDASDNCYNTGNVIATLEVWRKIRELYVSKFQWIDNAMAVYAKQQFLMSIIFNKYFNVIMMSNELHTHGHWGWQPWMQKAGTGELYVNDTLVMFNHKPL